MFGQRVGVEGRVTHAQIYAELARLETANQQV